MDASSSKKIETTRPDDRPADAAKDSRDDSTDRRPLEEELRSLRAGRAQTALVENLTIENYGAQVPLKTVMQAALAAWRTRQAGPVSTVEAGSRS